MSRTVRVLVADLFALTFGFAVVSLSMTVLMAARSSDPLRTTAPAVSLLSPSQGQIVSGNVVVSATASQDTDALQFQISGANLGPAITSGACSVNWNTAAVTDGTYALAVLAFDANGNMTPSGSVAVTVANDAAANHECRHVQPDEHVSRRHVDDQSGLDVECGLRRQCAHEQPADQLESGHSAFGDALWVDTEHVVSIPRDVFEWRGLECELC